MAVRSKQMFINLPVKDLQASIAFFTKVGFEFNPQYTDEFATCMIVGDNIFVMLLVEKRFKEFIKKDIVNAATSTEVIICISADSREQVDDMVNKALSAGGKPSNEPIDHGFMYGWSFQDPDGHLWEVVHMDESAAE
jgi:uncharacterized protein